MDSVIDTLLYGEDEPMDREYFYTTHGELTLARLRPAGQDSILGVGETLTEARESLDDLVTRFGMVPWKPSDHEADKIIKELMRNQHHG